MHNEKQLTQRQYCYILCCSMLVVHAAVSVIGVYIACTLIDMLRIKFLEKPLFKRYDVLYERIKK